jgi:hypothetical protein
MTAIPEFIPVKEIQKILGCSQPKAYEIVHSKALSGMVTKIGRSIRVDKRKFLELIENGASF